MSNESLIELGGWDARNLLYNNIIFITTVLASIAYFNLWLQLFLHKTKFDLSFIFSLGYTVGDLFVILTYFISYSIRIRSWIPVTCSSCYFEAYSIFYFNLLQSYDLTLLNICRYCQIVRNQNIYQLHTRKLILISILVPLLFLSNLIIQDRFGWSVVIEKPGASCSVFYTNTIVKFWNIVIVLSLPILISSYMLVRSLYFLRNFHAQQRIVRRNHHRQLIIHSLIFYSIWFSLWSPLILVIFLNIDDVNDSIAFAALLASTFEVFADPFIAFYLDKRFAQAWKKFVQCIEQQFAGHINGRIHPVIIMSVVHRRNIQTDTHT